MCRKGFEYYIKPLVSSMPLFVLFLNPCLREDRSHYTQSFLPQPFSLMKTLKTFCPFLLEIRANINPSVFFFCPMSQLAINLRETLNAFFQDSHLVESINLPLAHLIYYQHLYSRRFYTTLGHVC